MPSGRKLGGNPGSREPDPAVPALTGFDPGRLQALEQLLKDEPPYPKGTVVRSLQDERDELRIIAEQQREAGVAKNAPANNS